MRFGEFLVSRGYVTDEQVETALMIQQEREENEHVRVKVGEVLVAIYAISHDKLRKALKEFEDAGLMVR
ncbi:hypothetical protein WKV44_07835 [Spirochaetia bacterium 38H-sp]|uniref:Uncharacterized protein n=1 Tax=Rarispira pelagica TaxID=3141764 RepID=A0ABU9UCR4_9SPIR